MISTFHEPQDILNKLFREACRAHRATDETESSDHIFNFCITSLSLRDWCVRFLGLDKTTETIFRTKLNSHKCLRYSKDIANASKHFSITRSTPSLQRLDSELTDLDAIPLVDVDFEIPSIKRPSFTLHIDEKTTVLQFIFLHETLSAWHQIFDEYKIPKDKCCNFMHFAIEHIKCS